MKSCGSTPMAEQQQYTTCENHHTGPNRDPPENSSHAPLNRRFTRFYRFDDLHDNFPVSPLKIISAPSRAITIAKTMRMGFTLAFCKTRAPSNDPRSTPIVTGMAMAGL